MVERSSPDTIEQYRKAKYVEQNPDSKTWTAGIDAMRSYPYQDTQWHLSAIEFHHKVKEEAEALRDKVFATLTARSSAATEQASAWSASTHDEIIKRLMANVGMPNSNSLYGAFKQFANELHALAHAAPQPDDLAQRSPDQSFMMQEVLDFLNSIEGDGYGGMAAFEIVRGYAKTLALISTNHSPPPVSAPHNPGERLPNGDAAAGGGEALSSTDRADHTRCRNCGEPTRNGMFCGTCREMGCGDTIPSPHQEPGK